MFLKYIKLELFYLRKALFEYRQLFRYIKNRHFLAKKILKENKVFEKPINSQDLSIHILTGHNHLIIALWSLKSFYQVMNEIGELYIHSDGTLNEKDNKILQKFLPSAKIVKPDNFVKEYSKKLQKYQIVKKFRIEFPKYFLLKKLIDPYFVSDKKYHLIIDSDLVWFKRAKEVEEEIKNNCQNSLMIASRDISGDKSYVYFKDGSKLGDDLVIYNSGIVLYHKENFNLEKLSVYLDKIDLNNKNNEHFIEQAGYAYCLDNLKPLDKDKYILRGEVDDKVVVKHYPSPRRPLFYVEGISY